MNTTTTKRTDLIETEPEPRHSAVAWPPRAMPWARLFVFAVLILGLMGPLLIRSASAQTKSVTPPAGYTRIQLKHGGQFLDAAYCGKTITLNPGSTYEGGACQQWTMVPAGGGYYRIQLKHGDQILDAAYCGKTITLNAGSTYEGGACQLWRFVPAGGEYFRIQLKHGGEYLDAAYCGKTITLNPGSTYEGGACQLWRWAR